MTFVQPANFRQLPLQREMGQPFHIDAAGSVAHEFDPARWARSHILAILLTNPGERVMRPTYGAGLQRQLFENDDSVIETQLNTAIRQQLATYEPNVQISECKFVFTADYSGVMELQIAFWVGSNPSLRTVAITIDGTAIEVRV